MESNISQKDIDEYSMSLQNQLQSIDDKINFIRNNFKILEEKDFSMLSTEELYITKNSKQDFRYCPPERINLYVQILSFYMALKHYNITFNNFY